MRVFIMIFQIISLAFSYQKLQKESYYHKEQKLTLTLAIFCLLYDIPFWTFSRYFRYLETFFTSSFHSLLKIYPISILAIIRESHMSKQTNSQITQIFFFFFLFLSEFLHQNNSDISLLKISIPVSSKAEAIVSFEFGMNLIYITWLITAIVSTSTKAKGNDVFRINYICSMISISLIAFIVSNSLWKIRDDSVCSISDFEGFFIPNIFVLLASYIHWPYNTKSEIFYTEMKEQSVDLLDSE